MEEKSETVRQPQKDYSALPGFMCQTPYFYFYYLVRLS